MIKLPLQNTVTLAIFLLRGDRINRMLLLAERGAANSSSIEDSIFVEQMQGIMGQAPDTALDIIKRVVMLTVVAMFLAFTAYITLGLILLIFLILGEFSFMLMKVLYP